MNWTIIDFFTSCSSVLLEVFCELDLLYLPFLVIVKCLFKKSRPMSETTTENRSLSGVSYVILGPKTALRWITRDDDDDGSKS